MELNTRPLEISEKLLAAIQNLFCLLFDVYLPRWVCSSRLLLQVPWASQVRWPIQVKHITVSGQTHYSFRKHITVSENTLQFQKIHYSFRKHITVSENTLQFQKTHYSFRKHITVSENTFQFPKTHFNFRKHISISENTFQFLDSFTAAMVSVIVLWRREGRPSARQCPQNNIQIQLQKNIQIPIQQEPAK